MMTQSHREKPLQALYAKGERIEVAISDAGDAETCFGRLDDGAAVFVRGHVAVGDRVEAEVYKVKKKLLEARLVRVLEPASCRVVPTCTHFGVCGGCKWQHVSYAEQLRIKRRSVADALRHLSGFSAPDVRPALGAERRFGYRNKVDFSFSDRRFLLPDEIGVPVESLLKPADFALGFHAPLRYAKAIDIDYCFLATPEMNRVLEIVRGYCMEHGFTVYSTKTHRGYLRNLVVRQSESSGEVMVNLITSWYDEERMAGLARRLREALGDALRTAVNGVTQRKSQVAFGDETHVVFGPGSITERIDGNVFTISPDSFFQTNTAQAAVLYGEILDAASLRSSDVVYDLYCGTGTISITLAASCERVVGVEVIDSAVADAGTNAAANSVTNCRFLRMDLKDLRKHPEAIEEWGKPDVVVTDPPRAGMHPKTVQALLELAPRRIVYVSCKPSSLARDAALLCEGGGYTLGSVTPVDMFPHTAHIETVAVFDRAVLPPA